MVTFKEWEDKFYYTQHNFKVCLRFVYFAESTITKIIPKSTMEPMNSTKNKLHIKISWQKLFLPNGHLSNVNSI